MLDTLATTREERRAILHGFISPTPQEIEAGIKMPTAAHRALARLVAGGWIRVIVTTNFDRLIETALRDAGVEPTVIASADDAAGAMPLTHAGCVIVKLHGDYLDTRIRNTAAELGAYPPRLKQYLDRILDEFGLIVVGWSAEWDEALRGAIARCPTRRFTTWWAARGGRLQERARDLVNQRGAQIVDIKDADDFLTSLEQKVLAIEELNRPHPLSAKVAVAELKRYLLDPAQQIRQHDLVFGEVAATAERAAAITSSGTWDPNEFRRRVEAYEAASEILRSLVVIGARWGREEDAPIWCEAVRRTCQSYHMTAGLKTWIELQKYVPLLIFYAVGLGAVAGGRYRLLKRLFETRVRLDEERTAVEAFLPYLAFSDQLGPQTWNLLTASHGSVTPVSDRALEILAREVPDLAGNRADFECLFDRFEVLAAFTRVHQRMAANEDPRVTQPWFPPGRWVRSKGAFRFAKNLPLNAWLAEADEGDWAPLAAGMFDHDYDRFLKLRLAFENYFNTIVV
jgi:hypothetical protein